jgi:hypothetical protein
MYSGDRWWPTSGAGWLSLMDTTTLTAEVDGNIWKLQYVRIKKLKKNVYYYSGSNIYIDIVSDVIDRG